MANERADRWRQENRERYNANKREWNARRRAEARGRCACGNEAAVFKDGDYICARCLSIEERMYNGSVREEVGRGI